MPLTKEDVEKVAQLAHLNLTSQEVELFREQLSAVLEYAVRLQEVTDPPPPLPQTTDSRLREDQPAPGLTHEEILANAPDQAGGRFRVPPIFDTP